MKEETIRKLKEMYLHTMAEKFNELSLSPKASALSAAEIVAFMVDAEYYRRKDTKVKRLLREAHIKLSTACIEDISYSPKRNLHKTELEPVLTGQYVQHCNNVLISGACGVGKSYLACALSNHACRQGLTVQYWRTARLLEHIAAEKALGNYLKAIEKMGKLRLLVLDDFGPETLTKEQRTMLFEIIEERYLTGSIIMGSQLPFEQWYEVVGEPTTADAICDRIFHNAYKITIKGDSMRKKR